MSANTSIQWTDRTWNPIRGCSVVSPGCVNCYAMKFAHRFSGDGKPYAGLTKQTKAGPQWTGVVRVVAEALTEPVRWRKPQRIFVNSMSDLFHDGLSDTQIDLVFAVMAFARQHTFQVLTKRASRMEEYLRRRSRSAQPWKDAARSLGLALEFEGHSLVPFPLPNVWLGVSAENQDTADLRLPYLMHTPAAIRFVSYEPALEAVDFRPWLTVTRERPYMLDWIICGGESGPRARQCETGWICSAIEQTKAAGVACFVKQLGSNPLDSKAPVRNFADALAAVGAFMSDSKGGNPADWAPHMRVREFPRSAVPA